MINYLNHYQINKSRWDDCIERSANRRVYAFSWYLDLVCPSWDALVEDDYAAVFPLTHHKKWTIAYLFQPFFAQQLGIFSPGVVTQQKITEFIEEIPQRFRFVHIHLNSLNMLAATAWETTVRVNYELGMNQAYHGIAGNYAQNTRRNIKKAIESGVTLSRIIGADELVGLFRENFGKKEGKLKEVHYSVMKQLISHGLHHRTGFILGANSKDGILSAAAFFLGDRDRSYFLFAASAPVARDNGAMFFLIDRFIAEHAERPIILDFEGGNDPNLGRFYKSFGAEEVTYPVVKINRLSKVAECALYFVRKFRK